MRSCIFRSFRQQALYPKIHLSFTSIGVYHPLTSLRISSSYANSSLYYAPPRNLCSSLSQNSVKEESQKSTEEHIVAYEGGLNRAVKYVKRFSICSCFLTIVSAPIIILMPTTSVPLMGRVALSTTALAFGLGTTFLVHWFSKPYVLRMLIHPPAGTKIHGDNPEVIIESLNLFSRIKQTKVYLNDLKPFSDVIQPFANFQHQKLGKQFFVHQQMATHTLFDNIFQMNKDNMVNDTKRKNN